MSLTSRVRSAVEMLRARGLSETARYAVQHVSESYHERQLGIHTTGAVMPDSLGISNRYALEYYPSTYRTIYRALRRLALRRGEDVLLDYGCGKGRVLAVASTFPFKRVIGVELSAKLSAMARANIASASAKRANAKRACAPADVINTDAGAYEVPPDVSVIFFYNPFTGPVLERVLAAIHKSLRTTPRKLVVVFNNTVNLEPLLADNDWLVPTSEFHSADHRIMLFEGRV